MLVRALMALWPKCFRCRYDMPSGPVEREFLVDLMALTVISGVKNCALLSRVRECSLRRIILSCRLLGSLLMLE